MAARTLPNLGLKAFFSFGEDGWNDEIDQNFLKLSVLTQGGAIDVVATKPSSPAEGAIYVLNGSAISNPNTVAVFDAGQWKHFAPNAGWTIYIRASDAYMVWTGTQWQTLALPVLRALGALSASAGLLEQTGPTTFAKRAIGSESAASVLTREAADARYSQSNHTHPAAAVSSFNTRVGDIMLSSLDVQSALGFMPALAHPTLTSLSALSNATIGLVEQTGINTFSKRAIGTNDPADIPTLSMNDQRYQGGHANLTSLSNLSPSQFGVIEQFGANSFRVRTVGVLNSTDLLTRADADGLYSSSSITALEVEVPPQATNLASTITLVNFIRQVLIDSGLVIDTPSG